MSDVTVLNLRGLLCPLPVIKTQQAMGRLSIGSQVEVICTDPSALGDIQSWCRIYGHRVLHTAQEGLDIHIILQVEGDDD